MPDSMVLKIFFLSSYNVGLYSKRSQKRPMTISIAVFTYF